MAQSVKEEEQRASGVGDGWHASAEVVPEPPSQGWGQAFSNARHQVVGVASQGLELLE